MEEPPLGMAAPLFFSKKYSALLWKEKEEEEAAPSYAAGMVRSKG